jgi:class 3 adenylate cyclase/tetratricopeptide (TPR) repeat protein
MRTCPTCLSDLEAADDICSHCGAAVPRQQEYKVVTTVYCDVVGSTALEGRLGALVTSRVMDEYGSTVRTVLGDRGARVSKRHGDGFMATFGVPEVREDDAFRAVEAAVALRAGIGQISSRLRAEHGVDLQVRVGINTGNVLVDHDARTLEEQLVGTAVNLTKRFEEAADAGEILLGEQTYRLVADAVRAEPAEPLTVEGLRGPQACWRLLQVLPGREDRQLAPLVGRDMDKELLTRLFDRAVVERSPHLVSLLGPSGVGKSRLADEFVGGLGDRATVLRAKCPEIATSVTVWPMVEIVRQAAGITPADPPAQARTLLAELVHEEERAELVTERMAQMLGFGLSTGLPEGTLWALQRLLGAVARKRPLVVVVDDVQWAAAILLDAIEHLAVHLRDAPVLLMSIARPDELALNHAGWPNARPNTFIIDLSPLRVREGEQLVRHLLGNRVASDLQAFITQAAQGYPLMIEETVTNLQDEGMLDTVGGKVVLRWKATDGASPEKGSVPTRIQTLYLARLERLSARGRAIVEAASVVGERVHIGDVKALTQDTSPSEVEAGLQELVRLWLILPDQRPASFPLPPGSGAGYRFRHPMIRAVAYGRMPDDRRAELHERYADWLAEQTRDRPHQFDELIANHFSEAHRYRRRLTPRDERTRDVARKAGERYAEAGKRAAIRGDTRLVQEWLGPALQLLPDGHPERQEALPKLAEAQQASGKLDEAARSYQELAKSATAAGDEGLAMHATIGRLRLLALHEPNRFREEDRDQIELAIPVFDRLGDRQGLAEALHLLAYLHWTRGRLTLAAHSADKALVYAREAGDAYWEATILGLLSLVHYWGRTPLDEVERRSRDWLAEARRRSMRSLEVTTLTVLARVAALRGETDEARDLVQSANSITRDLGEALTQAADCITQALIEVIEGDLDAAENLLRSGSLQLERMGGTRPRASIAAMLARVVYLLGRRDEAEDLTRTCEQIAPPDQLDAQIKWRSIRAVTLARSDPEEAERLARDAVRLADTTDQLDSQAEVRLDLAQVLRLSGRRREAARELGTAVGLYREKGNDVGESTARGLLSEISEGPAGRLPGAPAVPEDGTGGPEPDRQEHANEDEPVAEGEPSAGFILQRRQ